MIDDLSPHAALLSAFLGHWNQENRLLRLHTPLGADTAGTLLAESFTGHEALGENYRFDITALSTDAHLDLTTLLGQPVLLELLTRHSRTELRPFHGHITHIEAVGANGGLARYRLIVEPWSAFLTLNRDAALYQDMTVFDIFDTIFKSYQNQGTLMPAWRLDLADPGVYPQRSLTTQYQESDWAFIERLMDEEGLFYYYEHHGDSHSPARGHHTLIITDHTGAFAPNRQAAIDYTPVGQGGSSPGAVNKQDAIDRWRPARHWHTRSIALRSWDHRRLSPRAIAAHSTAPLADSARGVPLAHHDTPGYYAYPTPDHGQRRADRHMEALEVHHALITATGTVRTLAPGTTFTLNSAAGMGLGDSDSAYAVQRIVHRAYNNLRAELQSQIHARLGAPPLADDLTQYGSLDTSSVRPAPVEGPTTNGHTERAPYRNRIDVFPRHLPYRRLHRDAQGAPQLWRHPKPRIPGQQTAIVVGPPGAVIHTDRDHRIKVQFHWQRNIGDQHGSHSRLSHPPAARTSTHKQGAPTDHTTGTWVRLAATLAPIAGANWGGHAIPRIGQEVLIDFSEGDIDRPLVRGSLYNGRGAPDAQHNQVNQGAGAATGNAPAWWPGEQGAHAHPAVLSGIKTQALASSQSGGGAYNQLVFDDSPGHSRTALQHHAQPHHGSAELNLGAVRHSADNAIHSDLVGQGAELKTPHSLALRAGQGLLLSSDARPQARSGQLDSREAQAQLDASHHLQTTLAGTAQQHRAQLNGEAGADTLPAIAQMQHSLAVIQATAAAHDGTEATAYSEPHLHLSSPAGITATSAASVILCAGNTTSLTATDINLTAQGNSHHAVKAGISLFTHGKVSNANTRNKTTGLTLHAASGTVSSQSQSGKTKLTADKTITLASITQSLTLAAKAHLLLTAQGACVKLSGGNIEIHAPGAVGLNATLRKVGPGVVVNRASVSLPKAGALNVPLTMPKGESKKYDEAFILKSELTGKPLANRRYRIIRESGTIEEGTTGEQGMTHLVKSDRLETLQVEIGEEEIA